MRDFWGNFKERKPESEDEYAQNDGESLWSVQFARKKARGQRKKEIILASVLIALMFVIIICAVILTDGRNVSEFTKTDKTVMSVLFVTELFLVVYLFYYANKIGKSVHQIAGLEKSLKYLFMTKEPLIDCGGELVAVYSTPSYDYRVSVFRKPESEIVTCIFELLDKYYSKLNPGKMGIFDSYEQFLERIDEMGTALIDISGYFI